MHQDFQPDLRCPACYGELELAQNLAADDLVIEGNLECKTCRRAFPVSEGAAYLAVLDDAWGTILKELVNRREIIQEDVDSPARPPVDERKAEQDAAVASLTETFFAEALRRLPEKRPLRLIDCGAGMFETSSLFAQKGVQVVATETEISMVRYANFQGPGRGDPQPFDINGKRYHVRDPKGHPRYFTRVVSDIQRLPFAAGTFDVAFCRAMLHHVDSQAAALREMARLVRPGGILIICAEPARSVLDREEDHHVGTVDREEGMNEQAPTLLDYRRPLAPLCDEIAIQYWPFEQVGRTRRLHERIPYNYFRHLWPGEEIRNWKWIKLLPIFAGVNIYARRNNRPVQPPAALAADTPPPITEVKNVYWDFDGQKTADSLRQGTERLKSIRRGVLARRPERFPTAIEPGREEGMLLESGWGPAGTAAGRDFRFTYDRASVVLQAPEGTRAVSLTLGGGRDGFRFSAQVILNGRPAGDITGAGAAWHTQRFDLSADAFDPPGARVVQVEIYNTVLNEIQEERVRVGTAVARIEVHA
jgi:SAM-dependent methyltransferase/uncharacterized protein YbaR (Trm112 family)